MPDHLHAATFSVTSAHPIQPPWTPQCLCWIVELVEVTEKGAADGRQPWATARQERFSIVFRGPREKPLQQGMYQLQHDQLGALELFLVPVGRDHEGLYYEAVFNRLR